MTNTETTNRTRQTQTISAGSLFSGDTLHALVPYGDYLTSAAESVEYGSNGLKVVRVDQHHDLVPDPFRFGYELLRSTVELEDGTSFSVRTSALAAFVSYEL